MPQGDESPRSAALTDPESRSTYRWIVLGVGVIAQASFAIAFSGLPVTGVLMRESYGMTTEQLGLVLGAMALGVTFSEILWGLLTDVFGDRKVLLAGLLSTAVAFALMSVIAAPHEGVAPPSYLILGICLVAAGVLSGSVNSSSGRAIMTWFTDGRRGFAMSIRQTAIPAGGALGAVLLPWIAVHSGFVTVYEVLAGICFASALATWLWLHEAEAGLRRASPAAAASAGRSPLRRLMVWRLAIASGLLTIPQIAVLTFAGVFLRDERQVGLATISVTLMVVQLVGAALRIWSGRYTDKYRNRRSMVRAIGLIAGISALALGLLANESLPVVLALLFVAGFLSNAWHGVAYTEIASMAGAARSGTAIGMIGMTIFASAFVTPFLIPYVLNTSSWQVVWALIGVASLVAVPLSPGEKAKD